mmetsp:Transcript_438/g.751  ORF Transcript_438/g.751 Transcript_438/m.751 type:complete len:92 (-) Transcript_438:334-609(-)
MSLASFANSPQIEQRGCPIHMDMHMLTAATATSCCVETGSVSRPHDAGLCHLIRIIIILTTKPSHATMEKESQTQLCVLLVARIAVHGGYR